MAWVPCSQHPWCLVKFHHHHWKCKLIFWATTWRICGCWMSSIISTYSWYQKKNGVLWKRLLGQEHLLLHTWQEMKANAQQFSFLQSWKSSFHAAALPLFYRKTQNPRTERGVKQFITGNLIRLNEDFISMETVTKDPVMVFKITLRIIPAASERQSDSRCC